jgi:hypothetical protein
MTDHHQRKKYLLVTIPVILLLLLGSTSLVVAEDGTPLTRSRYDPFGDGRHVRVAETQIWQDDSWVSLDPTQAITQTDYLERELNIYFTADGRYYDPWLGKYLQPDAIGGPPLIPQAADRYQVAGNSPTGVGSSGDGINNPDLWWADIAVDGGAFVTGKVYDRLVRMAFSSYGQRIGRLQVLANQTLVNRLQTHKGVLRQTNLPQHSSGRRYFKTRVRALGNDRYQDIVTGRTINRTDLQFELNQYRSGTGRWWPGEVEFNINRFRDLVFTERQPWLSGVPGAKSFSAADLVEGSVFGFVFDFGWQYVQDVGNPYLTPEQRFLRSGVAGVTGLVVGIGVTLAVGTGPAGFVVCLFAGWLVETPINEAIWKAAGWEPQMRLRPLVP